MDIIKIENLKIRAFHGVYEEEKQAGQNFYVNVVMYTNTREAGQKDDLSLSTSYAEVCKTIHDIMTEKKYDLLETLCERIAEDILMLYPYIKAIDVEVRKPEAPIPMEFESVSVKIHRAWHEVYIAFGSNMGDSNGYIDNAIEALKNEKHIKFIRESERIVTEPYGGVEQADFVNGVCYIKTLMTEYELLSFLNKLEKESGRVRDVRWGPRTLDLDIVLFDDVISEDERLTIPHYDMHNREFVLKPMCELAPFKLHPVLRKTMAQLLKDLDCN